jgi:hypothetical protein
MHRRRHRPTSAGRRHHPQRVKPHVAAFRSPAGAPNHPIRVMPADQRRDSMTSYRQRLRDGPRCRESAGGYFHGYYRGAADDVISFLVRHGDAGDKSLRSAWMPVPPRPWSSSGIGGCATPCCAPMARPSAVARSARRARVGRPRAAAMAEGLDLAAAPHRPATGPCPLPVPLALDPPHAYRLSGDERRPGRPRHRGRNRGRNRSSQGRSGTVAWLQGKFTRLG